MTIARALRAIVAAVCFVAVLPSVCAADVFRPAYLELTEREGGTYDVLFKVPSQADSLRLGIHVVFPAGTLEVEAPRGEFVTGAFVERWRVRRQGGLAGGEIRIEGLPGAITDVFARIQRLDGSTQVERLLPARPTFIVRAPQDGAGVAWTYLVLGVEHILSGIDHLLFVLALILIVGDGRRLLLTVTSFTVAHSVTLAAATLGVMHVPQPPVEAAIALSIVFVAAEIVHARQGRPGVTARAPWVVAFTFGLLHGLGFAGALAEVGLPERAIPLALLFFNVGVELGQLAFVAVVWSMMRVSSRWSVLLPRWTHAVPPYAIGTVAMFWVIERVQAFWGV